MDEIDPKDYCSIKPKFPKKIYFASVFMISGNNTELFPFHEAFTSIKKLDGYLKLFREEFGKNHEDVDIPPQTIVIPLLLDSLFPLKKEYWEGEHLPYYPNDRWGQLLKFIKTPGHYKLLVTPRYYDAEKEDFDLDVALPLKVNVSNETISEFMQNSNFPVNILASHSAIYAPLKPMRYNYLTKELDYPEKSGKKSDYN